MPYPVPFAVGDRVKWSRIWLRNTGHFTGPIPFLKGAVTAVDSWRNGASLVSVRWDDGSELKVLDSNLAHAADPERV